MSKDSYLRDQEYKTDGPTSQEECLEGPLNFPFIIFKRQQKIGNWFPGCRLSCVSPYDKTARSNNHVVPGNYYPGNLFRCTIHDQ